MHLYGLCVRLTRMILASFTKTASERLDSHERVLTLLNSTSYLGDAMTQRMLPSGFLDTKSSEWKSRRDTFHVEWNYIDANGRVLSHGDSDAHNRRHLVHVNVRIGNIPSLQVKARAATSAANLLGAVVYGDTIAYTCVDENVSLSSIYNLTNRLPSYPLVLASAGNEEEHETTTNSLITSLLNRPAVANKTLPVALGACIFDTGTSRASHDILLTGTDLYPIISGRVTCFERGFIVSGHAAGPIVVCFPKHASQIMYFDGEVDDVNPDESSTPSVVTRNEWSQRETWRSGYERGDALWIVDCIDTHHGVINAVAPNKEKGIQRKWVVAAYHMALVLKKGSELRRAFNNIILPKWKETLEKDVGPPSTLFMLTLSDNDDPW
jgi:hypothetical protein